MKPLSPARPHAPHRPGFVRVRRSVVALTGCGLLLPATWASTGTPLRALDIPAGDAAVTLKHFASQAGEQVLYSPDDIDGISTPKLKGEFPSLAALQLMLRSTPLQARQDGRTKAISITRQPLARGPPSDSPPPTSPSTSETTHNLPNRRPSPTRNSLSNAMPYSEKAMNRRNPFALLGAWLVLALTPSHNTQGADSASVQPTGGVTGRVLNVATGSYLNNARVAVRGTDLLVFTDHTGTYRLTGVPSGPAVLEVFYTGLDAQTATVMVPGGQNTVQNFDLTSISRYGDGTGVLTLDSFVVTSSREMDRQAIAIGEQRFAANIKNVVSTDAHGDMAEDNVAEFMKYLPGVAIVGEETANSVSIRGLGTHLTGISVDGARMAHAVTAGNSRDFEFKQVSINDYSRIEVTKVPTPAMPSDSLAGSVNLVSKSAFERRTPEIRYQALLNMNTEFFTLKRTPFSFDKRTYKAMPGFNLSYTKPVSEKFGFVLTASGNTMITPRDFFNTTWNTTATGLDATPATPYLRAYQIIEAPEYSYRYAVGVTADWRVTPNSILSGGLKASYFRDNNGNLNFSANTGNNANPTPASGIRMTYGPTFTSGATGRGSVTMAGGFSHLTQLLVAPNIRHRFDNGIWRVESSLNYSESKNYNRHLKYGRFSALGLGLREPARVVFSDITPNGPGSIEAFNNSNQSIDLSDINSYNLATSAEGSVRDILDEMTSGELNVRREVQALSFPLAVQVGGAVRKQTRDSRIPSRTRTYFGPGGDQSPAPFAATVYKSTTPFGLNIPWTSPHKAYEMWLENPALFGFTPAQLAANHVNVVSNSRYIQETTTAYYAQTEMRLWRNRLNLLTGVRYEEVSADGVGPMIDNDAIWMRNADGSFTRTATGARIRRPEAGANNSLEQRRQTHIERGARGAKTYDGFYPSLHTTFNASENLLVRLAYARTFGRPNFTEIIPSTNFTDDDIDPELNPEASPGRITLTNPALMPWIADNYDLSLEYYTDSGGMFSAGIFTKEIKNFFGTSARVATAADVEAFGLDSRYIGWTVTTKFNAGDARVSGVEFNIQHSLAPLGHWARNISGFVNATKLKLEGHAEADFRGFVPEMVNWGFTVSHRPIVFMAKWNYRSEEQRAPVAVMGPGAFQFRAPRTVLDVNVDYQFSKALGLFVNARNVFNEKWIFRNFGPDTPDYARQASLRNYGVQIAIGIKGYF